MNEVPSWSGASEEISLKLMRMAVDRAPVSIVITDVDGNILYVNPVFCEITGYAAAEIVGQNPRILKSGETRPEVYRKMWGMLAAGQVWRGTLRNRCKDGHLVWERTSISPIFDGDGKITHYVAVKEDITERRRIEQELTVHRLHLEQEVRLRTEQLTEALERAREADRLKDEFLANISHELRTPLGAMIGFADLLRPLCSAPKQLDYLDSLVHAGKTLSSIINDLLDLSKIAAGRLELESVPFRLHTLISQAHSVAGWNAEEKGVALSEQIDDDVPDVLLGDPLRLQQIVINLVNNAIKFTPAGSVRVQISVGSREGDRIGLVLRVRDTGIGMRPEQIQALFKPFSQTDASISRRFGGTGLGLTISKRLVELMGGRIEVESEEGAGSEFAAHIPFQQTDQVPAPETPAPAKAGGATRYAGARVLVVDDQPTNRKIIEALLEARGIQAQLAENGREAIDILQREGPAAFDMVLMDVQMPVLDGLSATRMLRAMEPFRQLPVVAITAHAMAHEKARSFAAGMNEHLGKPFELAAFDAVLKKWIPADKQLAPEPQAAPAPTDDAPAATAAVAASALAAQLPDVDVVAGLALVLDDESRYRHWLSRFAKDAPGLLTTAAQALEAGDQERAITAIHTLKGRAGMLGMKALHDRLRLIEEALEGGQSTCATDLAPAADQTRAMCARIEQLEAPAAPGARPQPGASGASTGGH